MFADDLFLNTIDWLNLVLNQVQSFLPSPTLINAMCIACSFVFARFLLNQARRYILKRSLSLDSTPDQSVMVRIYVLLKLSLFAVGAASQYIRKLTACTLCLSLEFCVLFI